MNKWILLLAVVFGGFAVSGFSYSYWHQKTPVEFYKGHSHDGDVTIGAPQHSGGTDWRGCHNASVPYHCH